MALKGYSEVCRGLRPLPSDFRSSTSASVGAPQDWPCGARKNVYAGLARACPRSGQVRLELLMRSGTAPAASATLGDLPQQRIDKTLKMLITGKHA